MCRFVICDRRRQSVKQDVHRTVSLCISWISIAVYSFFSMIQTMPVYIFDNQERKNSDPSHMDRRLLFICRFILQGKMPVVSSLCS